MSNSIYSNESNILMGETELQKCHRFYSKFSFIFLAVKEHFYVLNEVSVIEQYLANKKF